MKKQETLEEAAERLYSGVDRQIDRMLFIAGAKWQAERMYSELSLFLQEQADKDRLKSLTSNQIRTFIEQFKKK